MTRSILAITFIICISGCTGFSQETLRQVDTSVSFEQLSQAPDAYIGRTVMAGGIIAANLATPEGAALEIIQYELADDHAPMDLAISGGRFLATTPAYAETAQYVPGDVVTVVGELKGKKVFMREGVEQLCPILSIREIRSWHRIEDLPPALRSGYDPYYWGYPGDPYRDRPVGPVLKRY